MEDANENRIPLGLCKQAFMKLESFISDVHEIREDEDLTTDEKYEFAEMAEVASLLAARILNIVKKELDEDDFLNEKTALDELDLFPEKVEPDILDQEI